MDWNNLIGGAYAQPLQQPVTSPGQPTGISDQNMYRGMTLADLFNRFSTQQGNRQHPQGNWQRPQMMPGQRPPMMGGRGLHAMPDGNGTDFGGRVPIPDYPPLDNFGKGQGNNAPPDMTLYPMQNQPMNPRWGR